MKTSGAASRRRIIGIVLVAFGCTLGWAQPTPVAHPDDALEVLAQPLRDRLRTFAPGGMLSIVILAEAQECAPVVAQMAAGGATFDNIADREQAAGLLRARTARQQTSLLNQLKQLENQGKVRNVRPLWVINAIGAEATPDAIRDIATRTDLSTIWLDLPGTFLTAQPSWTLKHIRADQVWAQSPIGLRGRDVTVAVVDSGVDRFHPDLQGRVWQNDDPPGDDLSNCPGFVPEDDDCNGYVDDTWGWNFDSGNALSCDQGGHGTKVAGILGGTGAGSDIVTGVAPDAKIMSLRVALPASGEPSEIQAAEALQYAWDNGARIANVSMAWKRIDPFEPGWEMWRTLTECLTDLGLFIVAGAGNDYPHMTLPEDVVVPARAPRVLAVGALQVDSVPNDPTSVTELPWEHSSQGPSSWQGVEGWDDFEYPDGLAPPSAPLGLLKPDLLAPGVGVQTTNRTCDRDDCNCSMSLPAYLTYESGTSVATPHAAGVAALLLEKDRSLLPHELMYILRESARHLDTTVQPPVQLPPDNAWGYGSLNALSAVQLDYPKEPTYDLSITGTNNPWTTTEVWIDNDSDGTPDVPSVGVQRLYTRVRNLSQQAVGNVEVKFYYADVGTIGAAGFDLNGDGDPSDGNFNYIDSYRIPVIGPAGSRQAVVEVVVPWNVPAPVTDHWCVGVGVVAPNPPNVTEQNVANNLALKNFFEIVLNYSAIYAFDFFAYPDPRNPQAPFNMQFDRKSLPDAYRVQLVMREPLASEWFENFSGFEVVEDDGAPVAVSLKTPLEPERYAFMELESRSGSLQNVISPDGKPVRLRLVIVAPSRRDAAGLGEAQRLLVVDASNADGIFGSLTLDIRTEARPSGVREAPDQGP